MRTREELDEEDGGGRIVAGVLIGAVGLMLLVDRIRDVDIRVTAHLWPLFLIALGTVRVLDGCASRDGRRSSSRAGVWLVFMGCWALANEFALLGMDYGTSWPLLVVGAGVLVVWRALDPVKRLSPPGAQEQ
jgi:cell wall-active antibiotic response 4TMS protein YvqF